MFAYPTNVNLTVYVHGWTTIVMYVHEQPHLNADASLLRMLSVVQDSFRDYDSTEKLGLP